MHQWRMCEWVLQPIERVKENEEYSDRCSEIILVSLDGGIVLGVKDKGLPIEVYHPKEFPYLRTMKAISIKLEVPGWINEEWIARFLK